MALLINIIIKMWIISIIIFRSSTSYLEVAQKHFFSFQGFATEATEVLAQGTITKHLYVLVKNPSLREHLQSMGEK